VRNRAESVASALDSPDILVEPSEATVGGGAFPSARIPSFAVTFGTEVETMEQRLRNASIPVIGTIRDGRLRLDLRSIPSEQDALLVQRVREALEAL
jgi:L-seryl-tRNA(Ser) seleniumtransferase